MNDMKSNPDKVEEAVVGVEVVYRQNILGYNGDNKQAFIKISVAMPKLIAAAKRLLEKNEVSTDFPGHYYSAFESNIDFDIRFVLFFRKIYISREGTWCLSCQVKNSGWVNFTHLPI